MTQRIKVITVATRETKELRALQRSAARCNMDFTVLGLCEPWLGFGMKVIYTRDYLSRLSGYTHFIFVDAYDTLFLKHIAEVPDCILFSTEKNCWPNPAALYPESKAIWKHLNSGIYSAPIEAYKALIDSNPIVNSVDDQGYFTGLYLAGNGKLDIECSLFQSYAFKADTDFTIGDTFVNNVTGSQPSIIHFNGKCHDETIYNMAEYSTLQECADAWQDNSDYAAELNETFKAKVNDSPVLKPHRDFVDNHIFGFGERSFHWMWNLIIKDMPRSFTFLEIGVFKGQTLSLVKLIANIMKKGCTRYGVTPLSTEGGVWESDYKKDIETIHDAFKLKNDYTLLVGLSEDPAIIEQAKSIELDILYIDGGHEERHITNDIVNYSPLVKVGGIMVIDDCCNAFKMPFGYFQGIQAVSNVVDIMFPPFAKNEQWQFVFSIVHNRVYRRIK